MVKKARNFKIAQMALTTTRFVTMITDGLVSRIRYNNRGTQNDHTCRNAGYLGYLAAHHTSAMAGSGVHFTVELAEVVIVVHQ